MHAGRLAASWKATGSRIVVFLPVTLLAMMEKLQNAQSCKACRWGTLTKVWGKPCRKHDQDFIVVVMACEI